MKNFVLDTNILLQNPHAIYGFDDNRVIISSITLNELDSKKTAPGELGYNARETIRIIGSILENSENALYAPLEKGEFGIFQHGTKQDVAYLKRKNEKATEESVIKERSKFEGSPDDKIIWDCIVLDAILITNDVAMRIKAKMYGVDAQTYHNDEVIEDYTGRIVVDYPEGDFKENEFVFVNSIGRLNWVKDGMLEPISGEDYHTKYAEPKNIGQKMALTALLSDVPLVILKGPAGSAKTYLSLAAGLDGLFRSQKYQKVIISRTNVLSDNDLGFLPGDLEEKMSPLVAPFFDNLQTILRKDEKANKTIEDWIRNGAIEIASMAYMRGRSLNNSFIIIDEAQNATPGQILEIITRAGIGSKVVILGDPDQIDNNKLSKRNNGLVYASQKMAGSPLCAQLTFEMKETVRSPLATEAAKRL